MAEFRHEANPFQKLQKSIDKIKKKYKIQETQPRQKIIHLRAETKSAAQRVKNKDMWHQEKVQNKMFEQNAREFYRTMEGNTIVVKEPLRGEELENYWCSMFEEERQHQEEIEITSAIERENQGKVQMCPIIHTSDLQTQKLKTFSNFKASRIDKLPNFKFLAQTMHCFAPILCTSIPESDEW